MRNRIFPALFGALVLWTAPSAAAQVEIDTSSPDSVMASLAELHESWTLMQFTEFMHAALIAQLPEEVEDPASWQEGQNRWAFLEDVVALWVGFSIYLPLLLEGDPFVLDLDEIAQWLHESLSRGLQDKTIAETVRLGRDRESAILIRLRDRYESWLRDLEEEIGDAEAAALRPGGSVHDRRHLEMLQHRFANASMSIERLDRRREELEGMGSFAPGAVGCSLEPGIDLATEQAVIADLEALADTCPQRTLIEFLRAAAILSEVPARLVEPGARMEATVVREIEEDLSSASRTIGGLAAFLQQDPFARGLNGVPARLKKILDPASEGRTTSEVLRDGERAERAFLPLLRNEISQQLRSEIENRRAETSRQGVAAPERPSPETKRLRAYIERIDRRIRLLDAGASADHQVMPPGAN